MVSKIARCHVLQGNVTQVMDLEGRVVHLICPEYVSPTRQCRIKQEGARGAPLSEMLSRAASGTLADVGTRCEMDNP
jgi:hypothetical protein